LNPVYDVNKVPNKFRELVLALVYRAAMYSYEKKRKAFVGISFTKSPEKREHIILTRSGRNCLCDRCLEGLDAATRRLHQTLVHRYGHAYDLNGEWDVFWHSLDRVPAVEILESIEAIDLPGRI
jgi:hypothetical protein